MLFIDIAMRYTAAAGLKSRADLPGFMSLELQDDKGKIKKWLVSEQVLSMESKAFITKFFDQQQIQSSDLQT